MFFKAGEFFRPSGTSINTLRHYERYGLLRPKIGNANGYRLYTDKRLHHPDEHPPAARYQTSPFRDRRVSKKSVFRQAVHPPRYGQIEYSKKFSRVFSTCRSVHPMSKQAESSLVQKNILKGAASCDSVTKSLERLLSAPASQAMLWQAEPQGDAKNGRSSTS